MMIRGPALRWIAVLAVGASACGGSDASTNRTVFDPTAQGTNIVAVGSAPVEHLLPSLDVAASGSADPLVGVSVVGDAVRFARPAHWMVRDASNEAGHLYVRYVSPRAYSFAVYVMTDSPSDSWRDILARYEVDVTAAGAKAIGKQIAMATPANQGRAYTIERKVEAVQARSLSRELLLRGESHVVLVQIVTEEEGLSRISGELLRVLAHLEVR